MKLRIIAPRCLKARLNVQHSYKVSQDHIDLFFSNIRFHGGCNNNPAVKQFKSAVQKLIIHAEKAQSTAFH